MPRNLNKRRCQTPKCRNWAMRGRTLCRSHRNHELGSGPVGAPKGNFNALKNALHAQLLAPEQLGDLAHRIAQDPYHLDRQLASVVKAIHRRAGRDPHSKATSFDANTLLLVGALVKQLLDPVASAIFNQQLDAYLDQLPDHVRADFQDTLWKHAMPLSPADRVVFLRGIAAKLPPEKIRSAAQSSHGCSQSELRAGLRPATSRSVDRQKTSGKQSAEQQSTGDTREKTPSDPVDIPLTLLLSRLLNAK